MSTVLKQTVQNSADKTRVVCPNGSQPRVLFAEDAMAARILTSVLLQRLGCKVDAVEHGEEALMFMQSFNYDLVLMDVEMPVMDGVTAARQIRSLGGIAGKTPIIALSAFIADCGVVPEWQSEFDAGITKPAATEKLKQIIQQAVDGELVAPAGSQDGAAEGTPMPGAGTGQNDLDLIDEIEFAAQGAQVSSIIWSELLVTASCDIAGFTRALEAAEQNRQLDVVYEELNKLERVSLKFAAKRLLNQIHETREVIVMALKPGQAAIGPLNISQTIKKLIDCAGLTSGTLRDRSKATLQ